MTLKSDAERILKTFQIQLAGLLINIQAIVLGKCHLLLNFVCTQLVWLTNRLKKYEKTENVQIFTKLIKTINKKHVYFSHSLFNHYG